MFNIFKKNKNKKENNEQPQPVNSYDKSVINNIVSFIIYEDQYKNIVLGRRKGKVFISFEADEINTFLNDWTSVIDLYRAKHLSDSTYLSFIENIKEQHKDPIQQKYKNDLDKVKKENANLEKTVKDLRSNISNLKNKIKSDNNWENKVKSLTADNDVLNAENKEKSSKITLLEAEIERLKTIIMNLDIEKTQ